MQVSTDKFVSIKLLINNNDGTEPIYGKGTGKGEANCPNCLRNVMHIIYDAKTRSFVGRFDTVCDCGTQLDYSNAEKFI